MHNIVRVYFSALDTFIRSSFDEKGAYNEWFKIYLLSVSEKLPVFKFRCFGKYILQLHGYFYVHVSGQRHTGLER